jgi:hypothetical protein
MDTEQIIPELLGFGNKQDNNITNSRGRFTAAEFNQMVSAINNNTLITNTINNSLGGKRIVAVESEDAYDRIENKDENTIYLILDE